MFNLSKINTVTKNLKDNQTDWRTITGELGKKQKSWKVRIKKKQEIKGKEQEIKKLYQSDKLERKSNFLMIKFFVDQKVLKEKVI